jgi:hypothetical protein
MAPSALSTLGGLRIPGNNLEVGDGVPVAAALQVLPPPQDAAATEDMDRSRSQLENLLFNRRLLHPYDFLYGPVTK